MADYPPLPSLFDVPDHLIGAWAAAKAHACIIELYAVGLDSYLHAPELTTGDDVYDVTTHDTAHCSICAPAIGPLFVAMPLPPCTCEPSYTAGTAASSGWWINSDCPHHGDEAHGCTCRLVPDWYPGLPAVDGCPLHKPHRCNVHLLGRSWRSEGCGWRCPTCSAEWTLKRALVPVEDHATQHGTHPRTQCGPAFCTLLPPRPVMEWIRDEVAG